MLATEIAIEADLAMNSFCRYLTSYFKRKGSLSQPEVARRAGISRVHLNRIANGHAEPTLPIAEKIAVATGSSLAKILEKNSRMRSMIA